MIAIDDLIAKAPNFQKILANQPGLEDALKNEDGHIYGIPQYRGTGADRGTMSTNRVTYINQKWLDELGMEMPKTTEELKVVLRAFKDNDLNGNGIQDEIPLSTYVDNEYFDDWFGAFGLVPSANENSYKNISVKDGKVVEEKKGEFLKRGKYAL